MQTTAESIRFALGLSSEARRERMSILRRRVMEAFSLQSMVDRYERLYRRERRPAPVDR